MFNEKLANYGVQLLKDSAIHLLLGKPIKEIKPGAVVYQDNEGATWQNFLLKQLFGQRVLVEATL